MSKEATARSAMKRTVDKIKSTFWEGYLPEPVKPRGEATLAQQCKWPTCQSEEYQQALAEQIKRELVGEQPAQQEPVAFLDWYDNAHWGNEDFKDGCWRAWDAALEHTSPFTLSLAQRQARSADTWVSLTDEEVRKTINDLNPRNSFIVASAIEAKLKEKNNG